MVDVENKTLKKAYYLIKYKRKKPPEGELETKCIVIYLPL